jgi:zinc D-Ala-D-Ala carboxypeptidase
MKKFRYFSVDEFKCSHTGENKIDEGFIEVLDVLRAVCGFPFQITSGFRSPTHPIEARKSKPGVHSEGIAADIAVTNGRQRAVIIENAIELGFNGIGVAKSFIHVDRRKGPLVVWTY